MNTRALSRSLEKLGSLEIAEAVSSGPLRVFVAGDWGVSMLTVQVELAMGFVLCQAPNVSPPLGGHWVCGS